MLQISASPESAILLRICIHYIVYLNSKQTGQQQAVMFVPYMYPKSALGVPCVPLSIVSLNALVQISIVASFLSV